MAMQILRKLSILDISKIQIPRGMSREIDTIFYHCTAGPQHQPTAEIFKYWQSQGWTKSGYHYETEYDGTLVQLMEISEVANGVAGHNARSIHISYKGGIDAKGRAFDNRTELQIATQLAFMMRMKQLFPNAKHLGHRDISVDKNGNGIIESWEWIKSCPAYDLRAWAASMPAIDKLIIPEKIIYKYHEPGIKNNTVLAIQTALGMGQRTGYFGELTDKAVKGYQKVNGLTVDGIVGEGTAKALIQVLEMAGNEYLNEIKLLLAIKNNTK